MPETHYTDDSGAFTVTRFCTPLAETTSTTRTAAEVTCQRCLYKMRLYGLGGLPPPDANKDHRHDHRPLRPR